MEYNYNRVEFSTKRDLPEIKVPGYNTPQIRLKRSGQFGSGGNIDTSKVPAYATLPRNTRQNNRAALAPNSPAHMHNSHRRGLSVDTPPTRVLPKPRPAFSPALHRAAPPVSTDDPDKPVPVSITTTPCRKVHRISKEEQIAKQEARRRRKQEYFQSTPPDQIKITQRDLEAYVQFYEKKISGIVADMDSNIAVEKRKRDKLEGKLKKLLDANDLLSKELAGIRKDLKKCHILTETPV